MKNCPSCGRNVEDHKRFCSYCGEALSETGGARTEDTSVAKGDVSVAVSEFSCPSCGKTLPKASAKFCRFCGSLLHTPLSVMETASSGSRTPSFRLTTLEGNKRGRKIPIILGVILVSVFAGTWLVLLQAPDSAPPHTNGGPVVTHIPGSPPPPGPTTPGTATLSEAASARPDRPSALLTIAPEPGLALYYSFDANFQDSSGNNNHGQGFGSVSPVSRPGPGGESLIALFDGVTGYIQVPDSPSLKLQEFTLMTWILPNTNQVEQWIVGNNVYRLFVNQSGKPGVGFFHHYGYSQVPASEPVQPLVWQFLAGTFDGRTLSLYINGSLADSATVPFPLRQSSEPLSIGRQFQGFMEEVRIYNRALAETEIKELYRSQGLALLGQDPGR